MPKILIIGGLGYIGSYLNLAFKRDGYEVALCDHNHLNPNYSTVDYAVDYGSLSSAQLAQFDAVLWFAGHSSVGRSIADPVAALKNNCFNLFELAMRMPAHVRFVYASTASLYSLPAEANGTAAPTPAREDDPAIPYNNAYDTSKFTFDYVARGFLQNYVGLRMGTLSGFSPALRRELIFNAMNLRAMQHGEVIVSNPQAWRSILFLSDLYQAVRRVVDDAAVPSGFYNLASLNMSIGDLAQSIAAQHNARVKTVDGAPTYSFVLDTTKSEALLGVEYTRDMPTAVAAFQIALKNNNIA